MISAKFAISLHLSWAPKGVSTFRKCHA